MANHITYVPFKTDGGKFQVFGGFSTDSGSGCSFSPLFDTEEERNEWLRNEVARRPSEEVDVVWKEP